MGFSPLFQRVPLYLLVIAPHGLDVHAVAYLVEPIKHFSQVLVRRQQLPKVRSPLLIPGGGFNSALSSYKAPSPFNPMEEYKDNYFDRKP